MRQSVSRLVNHPGVGATTWRRFFVAFLCTAVVLLTICTLFVIVTNPYRNLAISPYTPPIMDINQRFAFPSIIRSGRFDSMVTGTSTSRLLVPAKLSDALGGDFMNLSMNDATAWEQSELMSLFLRNTPNARHIVINIDSAWCSTNAAQRKRTRRVFPDWIYDDNPWNDLLYIANFKTMEVGGRVVGYLLGAEEPRYPESGFKNFTLPEDQYDVDTARRHIWRGGEPVIKPVDPPFKPTEEQIASWDFTALSWLEELLKSRPDTTDALIVFMPVHVAAQPVPGSFQAAFETECKKRVVAIARRRNATVIDMRITSPLTSEDTNYWDLLHYRLPVGDRIIDELRRIVLGEPASEIARLLHRASSRS